jgi:leucyl aminopeptidase (aminopeptidase T)
MPSIFISLEPTINYNTLYDENASNHLAIGSAYAFNIEGGKQMTREELLLKCPVSVSEDRFSFAVRRNAVDIHIFGTDHKIHLQVGADGFQNRCIN